MSPLLLLRLMILLALANGTPVVAKRLCGDRWAWPLDLGRRWRDGRPLFGASKTIRGAVLALAVTAAGAALIGLGATLGLVVAAVAMAGDLCSSFVKRRLGLAPSSQAMGLDQVPESLLPLLAASAFLPLSLLDIGLGVALFWIGELLLSRLLYRLHVRDRPY